MEKALFFDAGPIITLVTARLSWILPELKQKFGGTFYITPAVKRELVERPLTVKRFEFEALQVLKLIRDGIVQVYNQVPEKRARELITLANTSFRIAGKTLDIMQSGEIESVASVVELHATGVVMDERTLRLFIENNRGMKALLESRFRKNVVPDISKINKFSQELKAVTIIRSIELVGIAYKLGLLNSYLPEGKNARNTLLDAVLWSTKYNGCSVTEHEIEEIKEFLLEKSF